MDSTVEIFDLIVVGGGPAGVFAAITAKTFHPDTTILILELSSTLLAKVRASGGGRCNVTNACFDPKKLVQNYPRGGKELLGPFHVFHPRHMIEWLENHGVEVKIESDGRVFPKTNRSETIVDALMTELDRLKIPVYYETPVEAITRDDSAFKVKTPNSTLYSKAVLLATGGSRQGFSLAKDLGHTIIEPVPSLFSFVIENFPLHSVSGVAIDSVELSIPGTPFRAFGPQLITHTGFSGPATLKLSAFAARHLFAKGYHETLSVNWLPSFSQQELFDTLLTKKQESPLSHLYSENPFPFPKSLWKLLSGPLGLKKYKDVSNKDLKAIALHLHNDRYIISGKAQHKEEFVTCGGISLREIDFRTLESKICKHLYFAGEILDIDGITGGFNLQNAWTTGFIMGSKHE
jgi:predicted Rossmann fold flavoprotein